MVTINCILVFLSIALFIRSSYEIRIEPAGSILYDGSSLKKSYKGGDILEFNNYVQIKDTTLPKNINISNKRKSSQIYKKININAKKTIQTTKKISNLPLIKEIKTIEPKHKSVFSNIINENFEVTFKELFGGGEAKIILQDEANILECGIDIIAQPPGKKLQSMALLSGGERAFTAIALLFGILKMNPAPFCVLDEIEAALDDVNVARYAEFLKKFAKKN